MKTVTAHPTRSQPLAAPVIRRLLIIIAVLAGLLVSPAEAVARATDNCFDIAIVGEIQKYAWLPAPEHPPNVIILESPVDVVTRVDQVFFGPEPRPTLRVRTSLHVQLRHSIRYVLMFLKHRPDGSYDLVDLETNIVRDRDGHFVVPIIYPSEEEDTPWLGAAQEQLLRPIHYRSSDAWWLSREEFTGRETETLLPSVSASHGRLIAGQGVLLDDYARSAEARGSLCSPP